MIHALADPIRGNTHARLTQWRESPGSALVLTYQLGTLDGAGGFVPDALIGEVKRRVRATEYPTVMARAKDGGAPDGELRKADIFAHLDAHGWEPKPHGWTPEAKAER